MSVRTTIVAKSAITLLAFVAVSLQVDLQTVWATLSGFPTYWIPAIVTLLAVGLLLSSLKWKVVLDTLGQNVSIVRLISLFWSGLFFNTFLPGRTGGDAYRAFGLPKSAGSRSRAITSVAIDRGMNLLALVLIAFFSTFLDHRLPASIVTGVRTLTVAVFGATILGFAFRQALLDRLPDRISAKLYPLLGARWDFRELALSAGLSLAFQASMVLINVCVARALSIPVTTIALFVIIPITALVTAIPISINGIGVREAAYATLLAYTGTAPEHGVALSLTATAAVFCWSVVGGVIFVLSNQQKRTTGADTLSLSGATR